jgi:hypothetical protein
MKSFQICLLVIVSLSLAGCARSVRPISNSGYEAQPSGFRSGAPWSNPNPAFAYRGELSEFDVLGISRGAVVSDTEIERTLAGARRIRLRPGNSILLIQSGALFPDGPMVNELSKHFRVVPFSGVPPAGRGFRNAQFESGDAESFSRSLRLAAARGGNDLILCYWGVLESANAKLATKTISWVPVVNWIVPDEKEHMRLRLKLALVDVRTGDWAMLSPEPMDDSRISRSPRRNVADQKLVESLKQRAYTAGAKELLREYSEIAAVN